MEEKVTKPEFKMTEEEVFVGAMNAAITGLIAALDRNTMARIHRDYARNGDEATIANDMFGDIAGMARLVGEFVVVEQKNYRFYRLKPPKMQKLEDM